MPNESTWNCANPDNCVSDECPRWHYHQTVVSHTHRADEKPWDLDAEEEYDIEATMERGNAAEILETGFVNCLWPYVENNDSHDHHHDDDDDDDGDNDMD
ncbi:hypothetical protein BDW71DRAFT_203428 [Aspergillus fruticulosus]